MRDTGGVEGGDRVGNAFGTAVGDVIARERHCVESGAAYRRHVRGVGARRGDVTVHARRAVRVGNLEMADGDVGGAHPRRDAVEPVIGLRHVENEISREDQVDVAHESIGAANGFCGPPRAVPPKILAPKAGA